MATIKSKRNGGQRCTSVVPDHYVTKEIEQLKARGYYDIEVVA